MPLHVLVEGGTDDVGVVLHAQLGAESVDVLFAVRGDAHAQRRRGSCSGCSAADARPASDCALDGLGVAQRSEEQLLPDRTISYAHGGMRDLEKRVVSFTLGEVDVMVATTISAT